MCDTKSVRITSCCCWTSNMQIKLSTRHFIVAATICGIYFECVGYIVCGSVWWCHNPIIVYLCYWQCGCLIPCSKCVSFKFIRITSSESWNCELIVACGNVLSVSACVCRFKYWWSKTIYLSSIRSTCNIPHYIICCTSNFIFNCKADLQWMSCGRNVYITTITCQACELSRTLWKRWCWLGTHLRFVSVWRSSNTLVYWLKSTKERPWHS